MYRSDIIDTLERLMEKMKEEGVEDITEYTFTETIYAMENIIEMLKENEE